MFAAIDESFEAFLRAVAPLSAVDVDVSFEAPASDWSGKLTRPTVNLFLADVRRSAKHAVSGMEQYERNGVDMQRLALPRAELTYTVSVWTSDPADERALLGSLFVALLGHPEIPDVYLTAPLQQHPAPIIDVAPEGGADLLRLQDGLKLVLGVTLTVVVDIGAGVAAAPAVTSIDSTLLDRSSGASDTRQRRVAGEVEDPAAIGVTVMSPIGSAIVNEAGRFIIRARPGDEITIETPVPYVVVAPEEGGVRVGLR